MELLTKETVGKGTGYAESALYCSECAISRKHEKIIFLCEEAALCQSCLEKALELIKEDKS